jgi:hypothetical protein
MIGTVPGRELDANVRFRPEADIRMPSHVLAKSLMEFLRMPPALLVVVAVTLASGLCSCATFHRPVDSDVLLQVDSYEPDSGQFKLTLRNDSSRDVMFLHYLVAFSQDRPSSAVSRPTFASDEPVMLHDTRLGPGESFQISGSYSSGRACESGVHAGVYACWFNTKWKCKEYVRVWSGTALNGPSNVNRRCAARSGSGVRE